MKVEYNLEVQPMDQKKTIGISRAAEVLGVHPNTLRKWADDGMVPYLKLPSGHRRFVVEEIEAFRRDMAQEPSAKKLVA